VGRDAPFQSGAVPLLAEASVVRCDAPVNLLTSST
jgi:hypothetical protein